MAVFSSAVFDFSNRQFAAPAGQMQALLRSKTPHLRRLPALSAKNSPLMLAA
ncbi:MAG: hypothetical protein AAB474_02530 [Patescibacteria group bacterium]